MATHDYDIANGTGAAVRADLNNALAAIVSNNSSASAPATTYAYMWWADTNDNVLKMRNSANNGWITLMQLDGTMLLEDGSAGSPAIAFRDDTNTGMFSGAADELNFSTGGAERFKLKTGEVVVNDPSNNVDFRVESNGQTHMLFVDGGNDRIGIGTGSPGNTVHLKAAEGLGLRFENTSSTNSSFLTIESGDKFQFNVGGSGHFAFVTGGSEKAKIDSSGNLGIGTTTPESLLEISKTAGANDNTDLRIKTFRPGIRFIDVSTNADDAEIVMDGDALRFRVSEEADADTALTERMRLTGSGKLFVGDVSGDGDVEARGTSGIISRSDSTQSNDTNKAFITRNNSGSDTFHVSYRGRGYFERDVRFNQNSTDTPGSGNTTLGAAFEYLGGDGTALFVSRSNNLVASFNRAQDGIIVAFNSAGDGEGNVSISGSTCSFNGAHLSRWSQLAGNAERTEILRGSVLSNLDEMCEWAHAAQDEVLWTAEDELPEGVSVGDVKTPARDAYTENNEQLNRMKVSDIEGDTNVAGVFQAWDDDDDTFTNDFYCAMTGDFVIRIAQGTTVARGDLLMSAGDGTAKPQDDDIVRSKTIAKVTSTTISTTYADGSYCVPCVLMGC